MSDLKKIKKNKRRRPAIVENDHWLIPVEKEVIWREEYFNAKLSLIERLHGSLYDFAGQHQNLGIHYDSDRKGWVYREWAPNAQALSLVGDFNNWNPNACPLTGSSSGVWEVFVDQKDFQIEHQSLLKVLVKARNGSLLRIPAYIRRAVQDEYTKDFSGQYWTDQKFKWTDKEFDLSAVKELIIYECHVGMGQEKEGLGTYREFADLILPKIVKGGYTALQMMAVQEHPYYGSFGYHVSNFFAPSSRFGTPEDLKYLINKAHELGLAVIMDIVHSHAVKNIFEGLNMFDGTNGYFLSHDHPDWDSKLFDYGRWEVMQFLLSNVRYWLEEFHFDGFRFDGVSSMLYWHYGHEPVSNQWSYFGQGVNTEAVVYLQLATYLAHSIKPNAILIAEDVTGMAGLCQPIEEGGIGFDYRLAMGLPDYWIKLMKEFTDENWNVYDIWNVLNNRQENTKTIAYAESHDQALVGDKTLAFWLMDSEMYWNMSKDRQSLAVDRGISLHKMIRFISILLGGNAYLNFMGNEFGHPEWIDFPREGNNWSYKYARRQWSLRENGFLRYEFLADWDEAMIAFVKENGLFEWNFAQQLHVDQSTQTLIFKKKDCIFIFNFSPTVSTSDYKFIVHDLGKYELALNSDDPQFGGFDRIQTKEYFTIYDEKTNLNYLSIYNVNRAAWVLKKVQ